MVFQWYTLGMEPPVKRRAGRPTGSVYSFKTTVYDDEEGAALMHELARRRGVSVAALVRQLVREEAARTGLARGARK